MQLIRSVVLLACVAGSASAQITTRPTTAPAGTVLAAGADLVIDSLDVRMAAGFLADVDAVKNSVQINGLVLVARVTNRGTERWAARGTVGFTLRAGREEDAGERRRTRGGVSEVPGQTSGLAANVMAPFGPFRTAEAPVPGSLAPGESRVIAIVLKNRNDNAFVIFERDKYYTLTASLRTRGDVNEANNRSQRVGRFDASRDRLITRWEPLIYRSAPAGGTVEVNAPPRR